MARSNSALRCKRWLAAVLAVLIGLGPLATPAYAAVTALADQPLNVQNGSKPNILLTVDDSTSMLFDFLPDTVIGKYCRDITGSMNANCGDPGQNIDITSLGRGKYVTPGYIFQQYGVPFVGYNGAYSVSGPGAGCTFASLGGTTCFGGIDPGPLPGLERYPNPSGPPPAKSPKAGQEYEYWTLWPAPVHNSEFNHIYYNPRLTYDPPLHADGSPFLQMNAANTTNWTHVPADPWASSVQYVDLTANVTVGIWCNSDWSIGRETDPAYCRTNGTGASATTSTVSTTDGDYNYPWAPPGINPGNGPSIAKSIAWSKVDTGAGYALRPAWTTAKDPQYFYQTDNILWCDSTSSLWPNAGPVLSQTCTDPAPSSVPQACVGDVHQTCDGTPQTCVGITPQTCGGQQSQTCDNIVPQVCNNAIAKACNNPLAQTCDGVGVQTCGGVSSQSCVGYVTQSCGGIGPQACNGVTPQSCNLVPPTCIPPDPSTCTITYEPPGCETCVGTECPLCVPHPSCPPGSCSSNGSACSDASTCPVTGTCSSDHAVCGAGHPACPTLRGTCSVTTATSCLVPGDCTPTGLCTGDAHVCFGLAGECPAIDGQCSLDHTACQNLPGQCPNAGHCTITSLLCPPDVCPTQPGHCSIQNAATCFDQSQCPDTGTCAGAPGTLCSATSDCPDIAGACSVDNLACQVTGDCGNAGHCSIQTASVCHANGECPIVPGTCSITLGSCTDPGNPCPDMPGQCSVDHQSCTSQNCPAIGQTCSMTGGACLSAAYCPIQGGTCSVDNTACKHLFFPPWFDISYCDTIDTIGKCSISHAGCWGDFMCPGVPTASASATCSDMLSDNSKSLLEDANGAGVVCRHNNKTYGATTADRYNYPDAKYNTPVTAGTGANACVSSARYATIPRHYWKTALQWCDKMISTAGDKWLGYGTPSLGSCQDDQDASHIYPRFFKFGQPPGTDNYGTAAFQRIDLDITKPGATYDHGLDDLGDPIVRVFKDESNPAHSEMTNYANWFAYYRTRLQAVKTVTSITFFELNNKYRVGFHALYHTDTILPTFLDIADFDPTVQKPAWYTKLFSVNPSLGQETPTLDAMVRVGEYFKHGSHPQLTGSSDPIVLSCQKNYHLLFTDGYTNQSGLPSDFIAGDQDLTIPNYPEWDTKPILGLVPGSDWPGPFQEDTDIATGRASNSLSDYAMYYWVTDLRGATGTTVLPNDVPASDKDPATWQHQNFAAVSLGTSGKLPATNQSVTEDALTTGGMKWPKPYPNVFKPDNSGVDDLWHAALNGRGRFVNAQSIDEVKLGIGKVLADTANVSGTRTAAGFQNINVTGTNNFIYRVRFEPDWAGSLTKVQINSSTGAEVAEMWKAATQLTAQLTITAGKPTPWFTERKIVTVNESGNAVPFLWGNLGGKQQDSLFPGKPARGALVLEFLRGNRLNEGVRVHQFRVRGNVLGDIVDSSPVYVGKPSLPYRDSDDPGYSTFKSALAGRAARVYVGANEGMFHAFDDATGNETWAYIPSVLYRGGTAGGDPKTGLGALAYQDGALPPFKHHFFVDSTPRITDVDFGSGDWHTIAVGGLGKGGKMYYALNVTQPADITTEAAAAGKVLWEFTDPDMGYSYGKPMIAKTRAFGGAWLVIVASGYNNASGNGNLYFIRASDGHLLKKMSTGAGSPGTPSGLAHPAGYTRDFRNQLAEQVYAGDLLGNFWRFDVSDPNDANWTVGKLGNLVDNGGIAQPVTTPPQIEVDITNGIDRWVFVGTGKLYDDSDTGSTQIETMYAFRDGTATNPWPLPTPALDRFTVGVVPLSHAVALNFGIATKPDKGWFDDLPAGQRIIVPVQAALSIVAYIGTSPQTDPCLTGLRANVYAREFSNGQSLLQESPLGDIVESIAVAEGGVGLDFVALETAAGSTPDIRLAITLGTTGQVIFIKPKLVALTPGHRMSWRLLGQ